MGSSGNPASSRAARIAATWPSIIPLGAITDAPASAWATATRRYSSRVGSLATTGPSIAVPEAGGPRTPQCPWSVYSHRHRSAIRATSSPRSARRARRARWTIPSGAHAWEPSGSLSAGMPNSSRAGIPSPASSAASLCRLSRVCWACPGIEAIGTGSPIPSLTNSGATRSRRDSSCSRTSPRSTRLPRSRRGRPAGNGAGCILTPRSVVSALPYSAGDGVLDRRDQAADGVVGGGGRDPDPGRAGGVGGDRADGGHPDARRGRAAVAAQEPLDGRGGGEGDPVDLAAVQAAPGRRVEGADRDGVVGDHLDRFPAFGTEDHRQLGVGQVGPGQQHPAGAGRGVRGTTGVVPRWIGGVRGTTGVVPRWIGEVREGL